MSDSLLPHGLSSLWNSPGQHTGMGSLALLQGLWHLFNLPELPPSYGSKNSSVSCGF